MNHDKGDQFTVGKLKEYLSCLPDDIKVYVGIGDSVGPAHYLLEHKGGLLLHPDSYMQNATEANVHTMLSLLKGHNEQDRRKI